MELDAIGVVRAYLRRKNFTDRAIDTTLASNHLQLFSMDHNLCAFRWGDFFGTVRLLDDWTGDAWTNAGRYLRRGNETWHAVGPRSSW